MSERPQLLILGAGPAGMGAALTSTACGLDVVIVDSAPAAGGQIYRAMPRGFAAVPESAPDSERLEGDDLRRRLAECPARLVPGHQVWSVGSDFRVDAVGPDGPRTWRPQALVAATGTTERVVPFPGWTLPGVIGLAAATILLKSQMMLPGARTVVAGCGPLLAAVAHSIVKRGGEVAAVVDLAGRSDWLSCLPRLASRPRDLLKGASWLARLRAAGVPVLHRHGVREARETAEGLEVMVGPVDRARRPTADGHRVLRADCLTVGHGLVPATEVTRLLGAAHRFEAAAGGWVPQLDADQRTTRAKLYAAGDGAGIAGAAAALLSGQIAGASAALDLGAIDSARYRQKTASLRRRLAGARQFGGAMAGLMALAPGQAEAVGRDTVVCRCEDVTRAEVEAALDRGAAEVNQLKSWTRCGMGPCQGRMCGDTVAALVAARVGGRGAAGIWTPRIPFRPVNLKALTGDYDYADIPIPSAAPL